MITAAQAVDPNDPTLRPWDDFDLQAGGSFPIPGTEPEPITSAVKAAETWVHALAGCGILDDVKIDVPLGVFFPDYINPLMCGRCGCSGERHRKDTGECPSLVTNPKATKPQIGDVITDDEGSRFRVYGFNPDDGLPMAHCIDAEDNCAACHTGAGCEDHRTFQCSNCNELTPWSRGGDEDDRCDDCWSKAFAKKQAQPHGSVGCAST